MVCNVGDLIRLTATFRSASGNKADPSTVKCKIKTPSGVTTTYTYGSDVDLIRQGGGVYYYDVTVSTGGTWIYRWEATGAVTAAGEGTLTAIPASI